jgi:conjugal transfer/entry exclusion protein
MATINEVQRDVQTYQDEVNSLKNHFKNIEKEQIRIVGKLPKQGEEASNQWNNLMLWREDKAKSTQNA